MEKKKTLHYKDLENLPRRWFPLPKLDGYILREFLIKYSVLLLVFVILFVLSDVYRDISDFLEAEASWGDILRYLAYRLPGNVRFILPISMLLGCMWTMATFGKNMEITAMRASGVSLFRCGGSIFLVGLIVTGVNIYFNEALVPMTERQAERIQSEAAGKRRYVESYLAYNSNDRQRRWLFKTFLNQNTQNDVTIKTFWSETMVNRLLAETNHAQLRAFITKMFRTKGEQMFALPQEKFTQELKKELVGRKLDLSVKQAIYNPADGSWTLKDGSFISYDKNDETKFSASLGTYAMHDPLPFAEWSFTEAEVPESPSDITNAVKEKDDLPTIVIWELVQRNPDLADRVKAIYMTVFWYRLAFPWACFLAVFLGIPLATKNERTGSLMAIISAVGIIIVYIVVAQVFLVLGKGGVLNPMFAGLAPTAGFILAGAYRILFDRN